MARNGRQAVVDNFFSPGPKWEQSLLPLDFVLPNGKPDGDCFVTREDGTAVLNKAGKKIKEWGKMPEACKILGGVDRWQVDALIEAGIIRAWKMNPEKKYSHWRISLTDCMLHKTKQFKRPPGKR